MIVSHTHKFVFAAVPKTGTHSVRQALRDHLGQEDAEQVGLFVNKRFPWQELAEIKHGHLSLQQLRPHLGEDDFNTYFKFAFVRNPYDRFVSYCAFMTRDTPHFKTAPQNVMRYFLFEAPREDHILFRPQNELLVNDEGRLLTDYVGRVEEMQASYDTICERIGIPSATLGKVNSSERGDYRSYYTDELRAGVEARYGKDIELFGYGF